MTPLTASRTAEEILRGFTPPSLDAVATEHGKTCAIEFTPPLPAAPSLCRHCDICQRESDDLLLACSDCREKSAQFGALLENDPFYKAEHERMKQLERHRLRIAAAIIAYPQLSCRDIIDRFGASVAAGQLTEGSLHGL
jgi:hypothetical protein